MRKKIVAANWKMNKNFQEGLILTEDLIKGFLRTPPVSQVILAPPFIHLHTIGYKLGQANNIHLAGQNCHHLTSGAFTGEISAGMLRSVGAKYVIVGHSERREHFLETESLILEKVKMALSHNLKAIYCCGEPLSVRENGQQEAHIGKQLDDSLLHLTPEELDNVVIAYEPIWAIGTGKNATPAQAQEMHMFIRWKLERRFGKETAEKVSILYGGSVKADNAAELFAQADVDGGLVGGASLVADDFIKIANSFDH